MNSMISVYIVVALAITGYAKAVDEVITITNEYGTDLTVKCTGSSPSSSKLETLGSTKIGTKQGKNVGTVKWAKGKATTVTCDISKGSGRPAKILVLSEMPPISKTNFKVARECASTEGCVSPW